MCNDQDNLFPIEKQGLNHSRCIFVAMLLCVWMISFILPVFTVSGLEYLSFMQRMKLMLISWWFVMPLNFYDNCGLFSAFHISNPIVVCLLMLGYWIVIVIAHIIIIMTLNRWMLVVLIGMLCCSAIGSGLSGILD